MIPLTGAPLIGMVVNTVGLAVVDAAVGTGVAAAGVVCSPVVVVATAVAAVGDGRAQPAVAATRSAAACTGTVGVPVPGCWKGMAAALVVGAGDMAEGAAVAAEAMTGTGAIAGVEVGEIGVAATVLSGAAGGVAVAGLTALVGRSVGVVAVAAGGTDEAGLA